ncbi:hypothetical protein BDB00DRAFT_793786 [Zychaea mexicana]|uniref:uncharacterized protein n=1 Tax=Zychaea mexicana TaxID=64656 RepID=UPI0022FEBB11|nr:uncharacterized protein BDB00DRAFT_793786 [Zychaea mexicana]KAI9467946.1 hypothetical protein BDB00DRAFT_793786 [Zychaea mexicana]
MLFCEQSNGNTGVIDKVNNLTDSTASVVPDPALVNIKNTILPAASFYSSPNKFSELRRVTSLHPFRIHTLSKCAAADKLTAHAFKIHWDDQKNNTINDDFLLYIF